MRRLREALASLPPTVFADLLEGDDAYLLVIDLPGADAETIDARVRNGRLVVEARREKAAPDGFRYRREERPSYLDLTLPLPPDAATWDADAAYERGVLEVRVPKQWGTGGRTIPIEDA